MSTSSITSDPEVSVKIRCLELKKIDLLNSMFSSLSTRLLACTAYKFGESPTGFGQIVYCSCSAH